MRAVLDADATRGAQLRAVLRGRAMAYALVLAPGGAIVAGAAWNHAPAGFAAAGALVVLLLVTAFVVADRRAETDFWRSFAAGAGLTYRGGTSFPALTPLVGAGDRREFERFCEGRIDGRATSIGLYTYYARHRVDDTEVETARRFTLVVVDVASAEAPFLRGLVVRPKDVLRSVKGSEWLTLRFWREVTLESAAFAERYQCLRDADDAELRVFEVMSPQLLDWLARHPLSPGVEYRAGLLCVWIAGHAEDAGKLTFLLDAARTVAGRLGAEVAETTAARGSARASM